ncbi:MAG: hypothetical protein Q7R35_18885 [Elusimicrobiota bacterium]|nr:hypothetical protein [Elusimicrobiota bacterium]
MQNKILYSAALGFFIFAGRGFAALPAGSAAASEKAMRRQASAELVVKVSSVTYYKDEILK